MTIIILAVVFSIMIMIIIVLSVIDFVHQKKVRAFNEKYNIIVSNLNYLRSYGDCESVRNEIKHFEQEFVHLFN